MLKLYLPTIIYVIIIAACTANKKSRIAVGILMSLSGLCFIGYGAIGIKNNIILSHQGKIAICKVVNCDKPQGCVFQYTVGGKKYIANREINPSYGDTLKVLYLPSTPSINRPTDSLSNLPYIVPLVVGFLMLCAGIAAILIPMDRDDGSPGE